MSGHAAAPLPSNLYNERSERRLWIAMQDFLGEAFAK
jgi:hypothetical protein